MNPILEKVFLALRTDFVKGHPKEHITLRYYKTVRWEVLLNDASRLDKKLPATIVHKGLHSWKSGRETFHGLHVSAPDSTVLDHLSMPHITIPFHVLEKFVIDEAPSHEIVDTLWLGKSIKGHYMWAKVSDKPIGVDKDGNVELDWSANPLI